MSYDPRSYWADRFALQGPTYVAPTRTSSDEQAAAFAAVLQPYVTGRVLDYGCGVGRLAPFLAPLGDYVGADINSPALVHARETNPDLTFLDVGADGRIPLEPGTVDMVVSVTVLQHVPTAIIVQTCGELRRVLRPGGRVLLIEDANPEGARPARHMAFRSAERYADLLRAELLWREVVSAERPRSHYAVLYRALSC